MPRITFLMSSVVTVALSIFLSCVVFAAIPAGVPQPTALEVLELPEARRLIVARDVQKLEEEDFRTEIKEIAYDSERSLQTRWKALVLSAELKPELADLEMRKAATQSEWFMRNAALVGLRVTQPREARELALKLLSDKALIVRSAALATLDGVLNTKEREALWTELRQDRNFRKGQSLWLRSQILSRLAEKPEKSEARKFVAALKEKDQALHVAAIQGLEKLAGRSFGFPTSTVREKRNLVLDYSSKTTAWR
jgi:hypothetical protein